MLYLFLLNVRKLSFLCMQTQFIGLILTYEKWAMGAFLGIIFCFGISTSLSSFLSFYTYLQIFFMLLYFRGFQSSVLYLIYTYIYFCSLSCNRTNCLHILLKKMTLVLPSGTFSPLTVFNICNCHYHLCNMSTAETFLISQWKIAMFIKLKLKLPLAPVYIYCYLIM